MSRTAQVSTLFFCCALFVAGCKTQPPPPAPVPQPPAAGRFAARAPDGSCEIIIDTSKAPDMSDWAEHQLAPVLADWYPKISALLPSPGYTPPKQFSVTIAPGNGVAATGGTRVTANAAWFRKELANEAVGALVHEEVHVVQQYGGRRRAFIPGSFSYGDITNLFYLAMKLKAKADPVSVFVAGQLTAGELKALARYSGPGHKAWILRANLVGALNRIVGGPDIYDAARFQGVTLRESTASLRDDKPEADDIRRLNRALLEDGYPAELARRGNGARNRGNTGWLTEGIPDYIRWFLYEPRSHGADMEYFRRRFDSAARRGQVFEPKYSDSYRISANFLDFVTTKYDRRLVTQLNDALREGKYYDDIWADNTGKTLQELNAEWLAHVHKEIKRLKPSPPAAPAKVRESANSG